VTGFIASGIGPLSIEGWTSEIRPFFIRISILRDAPTLEKALLTLSERDYQGTIRVVSDPKGRYDAVNILDIEDYLLGVIGREMNPNSPLEALKAQAIAARTHALHLARESEDQSYDLVANLSQAYMGKDKLHKNVVLAIEITRGQILQYKGRTIPAYFHASCGGYTEPSSSIWKTAATKEENASQSSAVRCTWCATSDENKWSLKISKEAFRRALGQAGLKVGVSPSIAILETAPGGHAVTIAIRSNGGEVRVDGDRLRSILGYSSLKSTLFQVSETSNPGGTPGDGFIFTGNGFGHGVGLCQFGAEQMARKGASSGRILAYYYPNCRIASYETEKPASGK
jgi:stage II sporulation protein D